MTDKEKLFASIEEHQADIISDLEELQKTNTTVADLEVLLAGQNIIVRDLEAMMKVETNDE